jgi:C4-dicarboxylate transporter DctM subunit
VRFRDVPRVIAGAAKVTAMLMFIIGNAYLFAFVLTTEQVPQAMTQWITDLGLPPWAFLIMLNLVLLAAGSFMEATSVVLIFAPIMFPIAMALGIDPIHLGIIMTVNMEIGMVTPPVGLNLFVTSGVSEIPVTKVIRAALPWLVVLLAALIIVTYVPWVSLVLPQALD